MSQPPLSLADAMELAHLYREHVGLCIRVARSVLGDPDEARDAAHEFFAQLAAGAPASLDRPLTKSFFRTAARNQAIKILERHRARQALVAWHLPAEESPRSNAGSVDEILLRFEQRQQAKRLIATLPPLRARVAELCLGRQLTSRQAAEELGVSVKAVVKQRLKLARDIRRFRGGGKSGWLRGYWVGAPEYVEASDPGPSAESNWMHPGPRPTIGRVDRAYCGASLGRRSLEKVCACVACLDCSCCSSHAGRYIFYGFL